MVIKNETSWLASRTPWTMLKTLKGKRLPRQRRLFAVACCRTVFSELAAPESRLAVDTAERYVDRRAVRDELDAAHDAARTVAQRWLDEAKRGDIAAPARRQAWDAWRCAYAAQLCAAPNSPEEASAVLLKGVRGPAAEAHDLVLHADLIREVFGNPFRPAAVDPAWLAWNNGVAADLTRTIYEEKSFGQFPVLADILEEAGCRDEAILSHGRGGGPHARGCWVLDILMGQR